MGRADPSFTGSSLMAGSALSEFSVTIVLRGEPCVDSMIQ